MSETTHAQKENGPTALEVLIIGVALLVLAAATYLLSRHLHDDRWSTPTAFIIAAAKGVLILLFYMGLVRHRGSTRLAFGVALILLAVLIALVLGDVGMRYRPTLPPGPFPAQTSPLPEELDWAPEDVRPAQHDRNRPDQGVLGP